MLECSDLVKHYGEVVALEGLSLHARPGRLIGFLGPNGSGKTTTMRAVFGLVRLERRTVRWDGQPISADARLRFGYMPEQRGLYPRMPAGSQLAYLARLRGMAADEAARAGQRWLNDLGLGDRAGDAVSQLSHGNQQRRARVVRRAPGPPEPVTGASSSSACPTARRPRMRSPAGRWTPRCWTPPS